MKSNEFITEGFDPLTIPKHLRQMGVGKVLEILGHVLLIKDYDIARKRLLKLDAKGKRNWSERDWKYFTDMARRAYSHWSWNRRN